MRKLYPLVALLASCTSDPGRCDTSTAFEVVYDGDGVPAFAGQALMIQSCGAGGFCHSPGIPPRERFGAAAGLDFDLRAVSLNVEPEYEATASLLLQRERVRAMRGVIWEQVHSGVMPPRGGAGTQYAERVPEALRTYHRAGPDGGFGDPLPALDSDEGREIFRNWLACDAPVIERTQLPFTRDCARQEVAARPSAESPVYLAPQCEQSCVDVSWRSIYTQVVRRTCTISGCHDHDDPAEGLDLLGEARLSDPPSLAGARVAHARLLDLDRSESTLCVGNTFLRPGDAEGSLFYDKVANERPSCGARMPAAGNPLGDQRLCAIREWIECGACSDEPDPSAPEESCAACLARARDTCDVGAFDPATNTSPCQPDEGDPVTTCVSAPVVIDTPSACAPD